jgi:hypothetical protein
MNNKAIFAVKIGFGAGVLWSILMYIGSWLWATNHHLLMLLPVTPAACVALFIFMYKDQ